MTFEIKRFNNVYGIKELQGVNLLKDKNALIYAPNGVMKSSFAKGIKEITLGNVPNDRIFGRVADYKVKIDTDELTTTNTMAKENVVVFVHNEYEFNLSSKSSKLSRITLSADLKKQHSDIYSSIEDGLLALSSSISASFIGKKKKEDASKEIISRILSVDSSWKTIIEAYNPEFEYESVEYDYETIFNDKTNLVIETDNFKNDCLSLKDTISKKIESSFFNNDFGSVQANEFRNALEKTDYFSPGHKLLLNNGNEIASIDEYVGYLEEQEKLLYESPEIKIQVEAILKKLNANKTTKELKELLILDNNLVSRLADSKKLELDILYSKIKPFEEEILKMKDSINSSKKELFNLAETARNQTTMWEKVVEQFKARFYVPFEIEITNKEDTVLGNSIPYFTFKYVDYSDMNNVIISESKLEEVLSSGEKKALALLYLLFDIECSKEVNNETVIVLDDVVDSFDYKNKYAMIEYLHDLELISNVQIILLTHNFDFYTTCKSRLNFEPLLAHDYGTRIEIRGFSGDMADGDGLSLFRNWVNKVVTDAVVNKKQVISLIPVLRNIIEFKDGESSPDFNKLTKLLHYKVDSKSLAFSDIKSIYSSNGMDLTSIESENIFDTIVSVANSIEGSVRNENIDLDNKLVLSIAIRIKVDEFLWNKYVSLKGKDPSYSKNQTWQIYNEVKNLLDQNESKIIDEAMIVTPEFIHVNSFMYEPLVDISIKKLKDLYTQTKTLT